MTAVLRALQTVRAPILIEGDANFTAANGVVAGSGTPSDPYVIAGWQIDASTANAIEIRDTTAPFVIRDIVVGHSTPGAPFNYAVYLVNATGASIQSVNVTAGALGFYVLRSTNISVDRVNVDSGASAGLYAAQPSHLSVTNSSFHAGGLVSDGEGLRIVSNRVSYIKVGGARDIVIDHNRLDDGGNPGWIRLNWTENAMVSRNDGVGEILTGWAGGGNNTQVVGNNVSGGAFGIRGYYVTNLTIAGNNVSAQTFAVVTLQGSSNLTVVGNRMASSARGVYIDMVKDALFASNDFDSNAKQADVLSGQRVVWNETYPAGGNHWSDYAGNDLCSGPQQDVCFGPDGIGDTPYAIDANDKDFLPLMAARPNPVPDSPPHAGLQVTPGSGNTSTTFRFDASSSWDAEDPASALTVRWDWESDGVWDTTWSTTKIAMHQYPQPGASVVRLEVRDSAGQTGNASANIDVLSATALAVSIAAIPTSGTMPLTVSFSSDVTGGTSPFQYHWEFGDGSTSNAANTVHIYITGGNFSVWLNVYDGMGTFAQSAVLYVNVTPAAVNLAVTPPTQYVAGSAGITVTFTASVTGGTPPYTYLWDFGDGNQSDQPSPSHTYSRNGSYRVSVTVTDARGQSATRTFDLTIPPPDSSPSGVSLLAPFVLAAAVAAAVGFAFLWWRERRRGRTPPTTPRP